MELKKDLDLFYNLVTDYLIKKDDEKIETIILLYKSLKERVSIDSVEERAIDTLFSLIKA